LKLTAQEEEMLSGRRGKAAQRAMELLVALCEVFSAENLIEVSSVQISGVSYKNIGDAGLDFLEEFAGLGGKVQVPTTVNPAGMDLERWQELGIPKEFADKQLRIAGAFRRMGVQQTYTCVPYLMGNKPKLGEHIAWAESSAVVFANSVLGARTNREGGPSALAAAFAGRTPNYGMHLTENRAPSLLVETSVALDDPLYYGVLGYLVGKRHGTSVPYFRLRKRPSGEELRSLCAALASSGMISLFHMEGVTPEAASFRESLGSLEKLYVSQSEMDTVRSELSDIEGDVDLYTFGCPHLGITEVAYIAHRLANERLTKKLWIFTSRETYKRAEKKGYVKTISEAGGKVFRDTCVVVSPLRELGIETVATNSCKAAHYLPSTSGIKVRLDTMEELIEEATR
jgi:predicted aconitase